MDDTATRLIFVLFVVAAVVLATFLANRFGTVTLGAVTVDTTALPAGVVLFSSTECPRCKDVATVLRSLAIPLREITWELESGTLDTLGIDAVPLTLLIDKDARVVWQRGGRLSRWSIRSLERAARSCDLVSETHS
ncbi:MAG: hypothetical protein IIC71_11525 [Acidobacteria bacterium]|nr:hypothetical protein [Acidobacteriota bacterium]